LDEMHSTTNGEKKSFIHGPRSFVLIIDEITRCLWWYMNEFRTVLFTKKEGKRPGCHGTNWGIAAFTHSRV
jgi:hypothetical protein